MEGGSLPLPPHRIPHSSKVGGGDGHQGRKSFCKLHYKEWGLQVSHLHSTLFYLVTQWRNNLFLLKKSHQALSLFLCLRKKCLNQIFFSFFSSNEFFSLGSYSVQDKLFRELEKRERDAAWETLVVFHMCVYITYKFICIYEAAYWVCMMNSHGVRSFVMWM